MLISELIEALQEAQNVYGDVPVYAGRDSDDYPHSTHELVDHPATPSRFDSALEPLPPVWVELR